jgi:hypothetical protein
MVELSTEFDDLTDDRPDEEWRVLEWRVAQLQRLGVVGAEFFADLVDWHEVDALVARGCPPDLAVEIVR